MIARAGFLQRRSISTPGVIVPRGDSLPTRDSRRIQQVGEAAKRSCARAHTFICWRKRAP